MRRQEEEERELGGFGWLAWGASPDETALACASEDLQKLHKELGNQAPSAPLSLGGGAARAVSFGHVLGSRGEQDLRVEVLRRQQEKLARPFLVFLGPAPVSGGCAAFLDAAPKVFKHGGSTRFPSYPFCV